MRLVPAAMALALAGCSPLLDYSPRSPVAEEADYVRTLSAYKQLAMQQLGALKYAGGITGPEISPLRKSHLVAFADWMACVHGNAEGERRTFAIFYRDSKVADFRL